ncbi:MAG: hypothetical protein ACQXXF_06100, partial [Thermoplasmatota archaeon]
DENLFKKKIKSDIYLIIGTKDELIPIYWSIEFAMKQNATIKFLNDNHGFTNNVNQLPEIISKILYKNIKK